MATLFPAAQTAPDGAPRVPVTVLTGFLGSGKTTLLNRLLHMPDMAGVAVVINEFGAVGLDHDLVEQSQESTVLLANGCICCTIRSDLIEAFERLSASPAMRAGALHHVVLETTGLADPAPILHTLMGDPRVMNQWRLAGVACTVDAVNGMGTLDRHREAVKQAAVADLLLVTKTDLTEERAPSALMDRLQSINPLADICASAQESLSALCRLLTLSPTKKRLLEETDYQPFAFRPVDAAGHHAHAHGDGIQAYAIVRDEPLPRDGFFAWLDMVASMRGDDLLRVKGLVCLDDSLDRPVVIHGVQHVFHPPIELPLWPSDDRRTRIVFITRGVDVAALEETLNVLARRRRRRAVPEPSDSPSTEIRRD